MLAQLVAGASEDDGLQIVARESVRIDDPFYYRRSLRPSIVRMGRLWVPMPGIVDQLRRTVPALRWRVSCVLAQRRPGA